MLSIFLVLALSNIPSKYNDLVKKALKSAETKVPKAEREDTKYPGIYEGEKYHFKLTKTLTSARTKDIKGFAYDEHNCAIVKRKSFNLSDGFAFIEPQTQKLFLLKKTIANDGKVAVFDSKDINIFHIMMNFNLQSSTDKDIDSLPINSKYRSKRPKAEIVYNRKWDPERDRPELEEIYEDCDVQAGVGQQFKLGVTASMSFNSVMDVAISFRIVIEGKFGLEVLVPDDAIFSIPTINLWNKSFPIPNLSFRKKFLGLEISLGAFFNIDIEITDVGIQIPLGFDYFKGYKLTATKYYEITPTTISDSTWEINLNKLPEEDSIKDVFKSVLSAVFRATFQLRPYVSLEFVIGEFDPILECGIKFPFVCKFGFDKEYCKFPYLKADFEIPIAMYYDFTGISFGEYDIIEEKGDDFVFYTIPFPSFCIGSKRVVDEEVEEDSENIGYYITNNNIYEERAVGTVQVYKQLVADMTNKENKKIDNYMYPLVQYNDVNTKTPKDRSIFFASSSEIQNELHWSLNYLNANNELIKSDDVFTKKISDLKFDANSQLSFPVEIKNKKVTIQILHI